MVKMWFTEGYFFGHASSYYEFEDYHFVDIQDDFLIIKSETTEDPIYVKKDLVNGYIVLTSKEYE